MNPILTPVLLVVALGFVFAVILTIAAKVFFVPVDETVVKLREALPGANCGGCGFAGCDDYAAALAADPEGVGPNKCPVGGADCAAALAAILGIEAGSAEPQVATVMCNGNKQAAKFHCCANRATAASHSNEKKQNCKQNQIQNITHRNKSSFPVSPVLGARYARTAVRQLKLTDCTTAAAGTAPTCRSWHPIA